MATRGARWVAAGLTDQVVIAAANAGATLLAAIAIRPESRAGGLLLSIGLGYLVLGLNREFIGNVLQALVWLAPFLPAILVHDTGRYVYLSDRAPARALRIDLVWITVQIALLVTGALTIGLRPALLPVSWGLGAVAGATVFLLLTRIPAWRGDPRRWLAETRKLSGWFTATGVIGQLQVQAVGFVVTGQLTPDQLTYLRAGQTTLL